MNLIKEHTSLKLLLCLFAAIMTLSVYGQETEDAYPLSPGTLHDGQLYKALEAGARKLLYGDETASLDTLDAQLARTVCSHVKLAAPAKKELTAAQVYTTCRPGVLVIGTLYKCPNCPQDHLRSASGFVIAENGVCVTSYHVFHAKHNGMTDLAQVAMDHEGNVYPVTEVLAGSKTDDIAVFKIDTHGKKLQALPLTRAEPGDDALVISHPHTMYYSFTKGSVSRYYAREGGEKMSVTADFSQGSSGGPVFNTKGEVIGVVAATLSLYNEDKNLQMVSRETIPAGRIRALIR